jgi:hypothetical protein
VPFKGDVSSHIGASRRKRVRESQRQKSDSPEWHSYRLHKSIIIWAAVAFFTGVALSLLAIERERLAPWLGPLHTIGSFSYSSWHE